MSHICIQLAPCTIVHTGITNCCQRQVIINNRKVSPAPISQPPPWPGCRLQQGDSYRVDQARMQGTRGRHLWILQFQKKKVKKGRHQRAGEDRVDRGDVQCCTGTQRMGGGGSNGSTPIENILLSFLIFHSSMVCLAFSVPHSSLL